MDSANPASGETIKRSTTDRADGIDSRNRGTEDIDRIFKATGGPAKFIADLLERRPELDVLEVGFGWAVALLELAWRFRDRAVTFHGVDLEEKPELASPGRIASWAAAQGLVPPDRLGELRVPHLQFYDASSLRYADESMDFVYSAVTIRFMRRKIEFIQDVARVLRPGGLALLHIGESNWNYPFGDACGEPLLTRFTSRLILKCGNRLIPLPAYFGLFEDRGYRFRFTVDSRCILVLEKRASGRLDLDLTLDDALTLPGRAVPLTNRKGEVRGGQRSVYEVNRRRYAELVARGLLPGTEPDPAG